jgi:hypothetical protein
MSYQTTTCERCGKQFLTSNGDTLCVKCVRRRENGRRLARDNALRRAEEDQEREDHAKQTYAEFLGVSALDVDGLRIPSWCYEPTGLETENDWPNQKT